MIGVRYVPSVTTVGWWRLPAVVALIGTAVVSSIRRHVSGVDERSRCGSTVAKSSDSGGDDAVRLIGVNRRHTRHENPAPPAAEAADRLIGVNLRNGCIPPPDTASAPSACVIDLALRGERGRSLRRARWRLSCGRTLHPVLHHPGKRAARPSASAREVTEFRPPTDRRVDIVTFEDNDRVLSGMLVQ